MSQSALIFRHRPTLPMVHQDESAECGHACVVMISNYWGHDLDLCALRRFHSTSNRGTTLLDLTRLFERLGFITRALHVPLEALKQVRHPVLLHWNMNHFVVLKRVGKKHLIIHDPAQGVRRIGWDEVSRQFTGVMLEVERAENFAKIRARSKLTMSGILQTVHGLSPILGYVMLLSIALECCHLLNPMLMQYVTDSVIGLSEMSNLALIALLFSMVALLQFFTEYLRSNLVIYLSTQLTVQFSANVVRHILKLPLAFFEKRHKGDIQSKFQSIDHIQKKLSTDFISSILDGIMVLITLFVMLVYSRTLTLVVILALGLGLLIKLGSYRHLSKQTETSLQQHATALTFFLETLQSVLSIKSFQKERERFNIWRNSYIRSLNADIKISKIALIYRIADQLLAQLEYITVVCLGAYFVLENQFTLGMLVAFLAYRMAMVNKAQSLMRYLIDYKLIALQLRRLGDLVLQSPEEISTGIGQRSTTQGALSIHHLSFQYQADTRYIFKRVSLEVAAGEKLAIVGPSGCGKSTFLKVLMGLLAKSEGDLIIDGIPLSDFGMKNFRDMTASVMQDDTLMSGSILENIAFFDEVIDLEKVYRVATLACIHEVIQQLPMRYETRLGDMGSMLSGGEKQRLLLARALYREPKILFLDEATSHLDKQYERQINQALKALAVTQIIVAHREETIKMADRVVNFLELNHA